MHIGILNIDAAVAGCPHLCFYVHCGVSHRKRGMGEAKIAPKKLNLQKSPPTTGGYVARSNNSRCVPTDEEIKIFLGRIHEKYPNINLTITSCLVA